MGKLEIEKNKLEAQVADVRSRIKVDADIVQREAEQAVAAMGRMLEAVKRLK